MIVQQPPKGIVIPLGALIPQMIMPPSVSPPPKPLNVDNATASPSFGPEPNMDIEENSPHQEGIITETYIVPDQSYLEQPQELIKLVNISKVVQQCLPRQTDIDKILNIIKRKVLKGMHLPLVKAQNVWLVYGPMLIPRQLRFSLYSGAVITEGLM